MRIALIVFAGIAAYAGNELVDRVSVVVGSKPITESRIEEDLRITAFLNGEEAKLEASQRQAAAGRLIERALLQREITIAGFANTSSVAESALNDVRGRFLTDEAFAQALARAGITEDLLKQALEEQARTLSFIDFRFRPEVAIEEAEAREFYTREYPAFWMALHGGDPLPSFEDARDDVDRLLIDRKVDLQMEAWLKDARRQTRIVYLDKDLERPAGAPQQVSRGTKP
jgi:hypothetical protein